MNSRERFLSILLVGFIIVAASAALGYQFVYSPWTKATDSIAKLQEEIDKLENDKLAIELQQHIYETKTKKKSLPQDDTLAQREYERLLDRMLRKADFQTPIITPKAPDKRSTVLLSTKKPPYTRLDFNVRVKGDLLSLADFLHNFYRQPLLHQIRTINVIKPSTSRDLDIVFDVEALVVDRAENRATLMPTLPFVSLLAGGVVSTGFNTRAVEMGVGSLFTAVGILARGDDVLSKVSADDEYRRIAGKNIFFGPPPVAVVKAERERDIDLAPFLCLTRVSHSDGISVAAIFDRANKQDFEIEVDHQGIVKVTRYYYLRVEEEGGNVGEIRKKLSEKPYLQFGSEETGNLRKYTVRRILESGVLLEEYNDERTERIHGPINLLFGGAAPLVLIVPPEKLYFWRVGQFVKSDEAGKSMTLVTSPTQILHEMLRPLEVTNEVRDDEGGKPKGSSRPPPRLGGKRLGSIR